MATRSDPDALPTIAETYDATSLMEARVTDLLQLSVQTRWSRRSATDPADRYSDDMKAVRSRIAHELRRRNDLRRRHPAPRPGSAIIVSEEPVDWPFPACEVAPKPGTSGTVVAYRANATGLRRRVWENRIARRFYVVMKMGDDFDHAPGSSFMIPVWQVSAVEMPER